eukprot:Nk52_evm21s370 gene=Nk52_evmTU21s370
MVAASAKDQFSALFVKNFRLQKRQKATTLIQLLVPIALVTVLFVVQRVVDDDFYSKIDAAKNKTAGEQDPSTFFLNFSDFTFISNSKGRERAGLARLRDSFEDVNEQMVGAGFPKRFYDPATVGAEGRSGLLKGREVDRRDFPAWTNSYIEIDKLRIKDLSWVVRCWNATRFALENPCIKDSGFKMKKYGPGLHANDSLFDAQVFYFVASDDMAKEIGHMDQFGSRSGFLGQVYEKQVNMSLDEGYPGFHGHFLTSAMLPFFIRKESESEVMSSATKIARSYNSHTVKAKKRLNVVYQRAYATYALTRDEKEYVSGLERNGEWDKVKPRAAVIFKSFREAEIELEIVGISDAFTHWGIHVERRSELLNMISSSALKRIRQKNFSVKDDFSYSYVKNDYRRQFANSIQGNMYPLPIKNIEPIDISSFGGGFAFAFAASFLLPMFLGNVVRDKEEKHLIMMNMCGLQPSTYWFITFIYNYVVYALVISCVIGFSMLYEFRIFVETSLIVLLLLYSLWGVAIICMSFFLSTFFDKQRSSAVVGYLLVISGVIASNMIDQLSVFPEDKVPPFWYMAYPPFAFYRSLRLIESGCVRLECLTVDDLSPDGVFLYCLLYIGGSTCILAILTSYLLCVSPHQFGIRKGYLFFIPQVLKRLFSRALCCFRVERVERLDISQVYLLWENSDRAVSDEKVEQEEDLVGSGELNEKNCSVVLDSIVKVYDTGSGSKLKDFLSGLSCGFWRPTVNAKAQPAVDRVSLGIRKKECLGLLGANGAGKTTLMSMLTGLNEVTSGRVRVRGLDLENRSQEIHSIMGVCHQFDILHNLLTVREHLVFYSTLRGISNVNESVDSLLNDVNLHSVGDLLAKELSGGMRRRLSIAIAICGDPSVLVLDEPTTGLDPVSRRSVWTALERVKVNRSVIITTHAMEEANRLCDRIAVMWKGQLKCLGSPARLKSVYGKGYTLSIYCKERAALSVENLSAHPFEKIKNFVLREIPGASLVESHNDSIAFCVPQDMVNPSKIFRSMKSQKDILQIVDWGLKMTTLEDVFLVVMKNELAYT